MGNTLQSTDVMMRWFSYLQTGCFPPAFVFMSNQANPPMVPISYLIEDTRLVTILSHFIYSSIVCPGGGLAPNTIVQNVLPSWGIRRCSKARIWQGKSCTQCAWRELMRTPMLSSFLRCWSCSLILLVITCSSWGQIVGWNVDGLV